MALIDDCVLHNTLGSNAECAASEIGVNGVVSGGPTYEAVKFDDGVGNLGLRGVLSVVFANAVVAGVGNQGCLDLWFKPKFNSGATVANLFTLFFGAAENINIFYNNGFFLSAIGGGLSATYKWTPAFNANDIIHLLFVWDNTAGAGAKAKLYVDGALEAVAASAPDNAWVVGNALDFQIYNEIPANDTYRDNIKIYDDISAATITAILANMNNEGFAPRQVTSVSASDGTYTTHVEVSWDTESSSTSYNVYRSDNDVDYDLIETVTTTSYNDADTVAGQTYYYKVSGVNASGEGPLSASDDGYRAIRQAALDCAIERPQVLILDDDTDIYARGYVDKLIRIEENKTFRRDKLLINSINMKVKNYDNFFSLDSNESIFKNIQWRYEQFKIIAEDGQVLWDGVLRNITRIHDKPKTAIIRSDDLLSKFIKRTISYTSSDWETPAEAFKNILEQEGYTQYNVKSVQDSINQQDDNSCYIKCFINQEDDITLHQIAEKLGEIGCADVFSSFNELYYKHWQSFTGGVKVDLVESDMKKVPIVSSPDSDLFNDYNIGYDGDVDVQLTDSAAGNIGSLSRDVYGTQNLREFNCSSGNQIVFKDSASAQYIGECYIKRSHIYLSTNPRPLQTINFDIRYSNKNWTDLETYFRLTLSDEDWTDKLFEIFKIIYDYDANNINITALEVDEDA